MAQGVNKLLFLSIKKITNLLANCPTPKPFPAKPKNSNRANKTARLVAARKQEELDLNILIQTKSATSLLPAHFLH